MPTQHPPLRIVVAATIKSRAIGKGGALPWSIPEDLRYFSFLTKETHDPTRFVNAVILGRKTWESLPPKYRPLPQRLNIVVSTTLPCRRLPSPEEEENHGSFYVVRSLEEALQDLAKWRHKVPQAFLIGGARLFDEALKSGDVDKVFMTRVGREFEGCDVFFPSLDTEKYRMSSVSPSRGHGDVPYDFAVYDRVESSGADDSEGTSPTEFERFLAQQKTSRGRELIRCLPHVKQRGHEEFQYLDLITEILNRGELQADRTGVGSLALFGRQLRFDLSQTFPLLTTKRVFWRGVVEELLWFIRGDTNSNHLTETGVKIWDANGTREFLDSRGLHHREVGDLGPVYGFQWRHFGAAYTDMHADYRNKGVDQLAECIRQLRTAPADRRIVMSAWNPADLKDMALPPCHMFCQFHVADGKLSCQMYQRSCDMGLGVPFNIASYALLTLLVAQVVGLKPGDFVHTLGNAHVYVNHVDTLKEQLLRDPRPFPVLKINPEVKDIDGFKWSDFELIGYNPHPKLSMELAV